MPNFSICWIDNASVPNGVHLGFIGAKPETIIIKNVKFYPTNYIERETVIHSVILCESIVHRFFEFPNHCGSYDKMTFQIKQEGEIGWDVTIDINEKKSYIETAKYQVL